MAILIFKKISFYRVIYKSSYIKPNSFFDSEPDQPPKTSHSSPEPMFKCCWFGAFLLLSLLWDPSLDIQNLHSAAGRIREGGADMSS